MKNQEDIDDFEKKYGYEAAERAAIYEYDCGMSRSQAERKVLSEIHERKQKQAASISILPR